MMPGWSAESQYIPNSSFTTGFLSLPSELDIRSSIRTETFRPLTNAPKEDIILLAEFSEIEGPMPLVTIPSSPSPLVDLNDLVVKVMSTDYLNTSGEFRVCGDTQMVQHDIEPGIHVYVHYFTLYDVRARGFVRPMCFSYITADSRKLLKYFSQLRQLFTSAAEYLKLSNLEWFSQEMHGLISNLEYTKDRYIQMQRHVLQDSPQKSPVELSKEADSSDFEDDIEVIEGRIERHRVHSAKEAEFSNIESVFQDTSMRISPAYACTTVSQESPDSTDNKNSDVFENVSSDAHVSNIAATGSDSEESLLRHTTLESVAMQLMECQHILDIIRPYLDKKDIKDDLNHLLNEITTKPESPLCKAMKKMEMLEKPEENPTPSICILSLMKKNFSQMRSVQMLCGYGFIGCLLKLRFTYEKYRKSMITLMFEDFDADVYDNVLGSLFIGNIPTIKLVQCDNSPSVPKSNPYASLCYDDHFIKLLTSVPSQTSTPESEYADAVETYKEGPNISQAIDCLQVFPVKKNRKEEEEDEVILASPLESQSPVFEKCTEAVESTTSGAIECQEVGEDMQDERNGDKQGRNSQRSSNSSSCSGSSNMPLDWGHFEGIEEEEVVQAGVAFALGEEVQPRININDRMATSQACRLSGLVQQFCGVSHCLIHALLSGRPIILAAADNYKPLVMLYVRALSTLLPRSAKQQLPVLRWHTGTITSHHIKQFQVMGVCIPERLHVQDLMSNATLNQVTVLNIETGHISGVAYSGMLVRGVEQYVRRLFGSNSSLQASLQAILVSLGLKVYLLFHLQRTTNRSTNEILKGIGVTKGDWDIVDNLCSIVESQIKESV